MAQANLAREPSMEEILASIRKIIESNDTADAQRKTEEDLAKARTDGDVEDGPKEPSKTDLETPPSLIAVAKPTSAPEPDPPQTDEVSDMPAPGAGSDDTPESAVIGGYTAERVTSSVALENERAGTPAVAQPMRDASPSLKTNLRASDPAEGVRETLAAETSAAKIGGGLISPQTGERVARSFETLNHAVTHGPSRSFDEIAQDMLRPILRQWMDDNLPGLVEQLVREEIERVVQRR